MGREDRKRSRSKSPDKSKEEVSRDDRYDERSKRSRSPPHHDRRRSRSRSPPHHDRRRRSRSPKRDDRREDRRKRSRSPPTRRSSITPDKEVTPSTKEATKPKNSRDKNGKDKKDKSKEQEKVEVQKTKEELLAELDPNSEEYMMLQMGFPVGFDSTKGKKVEGADVSAAKVIPKRQFRQYMNRRGGFNRPLETANIAK